MQPDSWLPQKTEVSHYLKIYANKGRAKIGGNNYLPEKLELQPLTNCTMGRVSDVRLNSTRAFGLGKVFLFKVSQISMGQRKHFLKYFSPSKRKLILQDDQNKQNSHLRYPPQLTVLLGVSSGRFLPDPLAS